MNMSNISIMVDHSHNNLLTTDNPEFNDFFTSLQNNGYFIHTNETLISSATFRNNNIRTFILGVPQTSFLTHNEINVLLDFVRNGGSLIVIHRYGGDLVQKTNLNELTSHFGIYCENTLGCSKNNIGAKSIPVLDSTSFGRNDIMKGIRKVIFPGACSLRLSDEADMLCEINDAGWIDKFHAHSFRWESIGLSIEQSIEQQMAKRLKHSQDDKNYQSENYSEEPDINVHLSLKKDEYPDILGPTLRINRQPNAFPVSAFSIYGQGSMIVLGSPDFLNNNSKFGYHSLDNQKFFQNILKALTEPTSERETQDWILQQLGVLTKKLGGVTDSMDKIKNMMIRYDDRLRDLEIKFYSVKGVHLPNSKKLD